MELLEEAKRQNQEDPIAGKTQQVENVSFQSPFEKVRNNFFDNYNYEF